MINGIVYAWRIVGVCAWIESKYEQYLRRHLAKARLIQDNHSSMRLEHLFDLLCILLGDTFLEHLWKRLDKLFGLKI